MCKHTIKKFTAGLGTVNDSQKTYPKCRFILVQFLVSESSAARAKKDFNPHESQSACLVRGPRGGALDDAGEIKVSDCNRERDILLWTKEADVVP